MSTAPLEGLSLKQLTARHNALPGVTPVARFKNQPAALARIAAAEAAQLPEPEPTKPATEHASASADGADASSAGDTAASTSRPSTDAASGRRRAGAASARYCG